MASNVLYGDAARRAPGAEYDHALVWSCLILLTFGLVMVYSASIAIAEGGRGTGYQPTYYLVRHGIYLGIGAVFAVVAFQIPMDVWRRLAPWLFAAGVFLLALVLGLGREVNGSKRWLSLIFFNLQPSEPMKLFAALYAADYTTRKSAFMNNLQRGFLPLFAVMMLVGGLLLREPDFGAFVVIMSISMGILFLGGMNWKLFAGLIVLLVAGFVLLILTSPYRLQRVVGFMDPWADPFGKGYQLSHALIAFGRGEWFGVGLGASVEKLFYLPEAHTDFLLAVVAEELGFAGVALVLALFIVIVTRAFAIGREAGLRERNYSALVAHGIGLWFGVQTLINIGVNMGMLPTKGLTLPLLSYGGSGIVANLTALAVLVRVDWENRQLARGLAV